MVVTESRRLRCGNIKRISIIMLSYKTLLTLKSLGLGTLLLGLAQTPAMGFQLDLFDEFNEGTTQTGYFNGMEIGPGGANGQLVAINEPIPNSGFAIINPSENTNTNLTNAIGGSRHMKIEASSSNNVITFDTATDNHPDFLNLESGEVEPTATIVWNGSTTVDYDNLFTDANLSNLNLEQEGDDSIGVEIRFSDLGGLMTIELYDGTNAPYPYEQTIPVVGNSNQSQILYFDFATYKSNSVDTTSIEYIKMTITGSAGYDASFNFIETAVQPIPFTFSPGLGLVVSGGFFSFLAVRSKKANKSENLKTD